VAATTVAATVTATTVTTPMPAVTATAAATPAITAAATVPAAIAATVITTPATVIAIGITIRIVWVIPVIDDGRAGTVIGVSGVTVTAYITVIRYDVTTGKKTHKARQRQAGKHAFGGGVHGGDSMRSV